MLQMTLHLTRSSCLWTFQLLEVEVFQVRLQKKLLQPFPISIEIHKGAIFDRLNIIDSYLCIQAKKCIFFVLFLGEAQPRLENRRGEKALFGRDVH
jgi:hypothetical protein